MIRKKSLFISKISSVSMCKIQNELKPEDGPTEIPL